MDGPSNAEGYGAGIVLQSPNRQETIEYAFKLRFRASNNKAEYEALLAGLQLALKMSLIRF